MTLLGRFLDWLRGGDASSPRPLRTAHADDVPTVLSRDTIYIIGDASGSWSVALLCPCGCKAIVQLSTMRGSRPRWRLQPERDGTVSLYPSVWRTQGCRSHFLVRFGRIIWCTDDDIPTEAGDRRASEA